MSDAARLQQIRERLEKTRSGPWYFTSEEGRDAAGRETASICSGGLGISEEETEPHVCIATTAAADRDQAVADARFLAAARQDVPWLLDQYLTAVDRARQQTEQLRGHIDPDCEVVRGVGAYCTCETPEEKAERAKEQAECEAEREKIAVDPARPPVWQTTEAPKDGVPFIALHADGKVSKVHWSERYEPAGWATEEEFFAKPFVAWMPLPAPPAGKGEPPQY